MFLTQFTVNFNKKEVCDAFIGNIKAITGEMKQMPEIELELDGTGGINIKLIIPNEKLIHGDK